MGRYTSFPLPELCLAQSHRPKYPRSGATASISVCSCHPWAVNGYPEGLLPDDLRYCTTVQRFATPTTRRGGFDMNQDNDRQHTPGQTPVAVRGTHSAPGEPGPQPRRGPARAVWERCVAVPPGVVCQDEAGRLWSVGPSSGSTRQAHGTGELPAGRIGCSAAGNGHSG
jgi:hypothetical protein